MPIAIVCSVTVSMGELTSGSRSEMLREIFVSSFTASTPKSMCPVRSQRQETVSPRVRTQMQQHEEVKAEPAQSLGSAGPQYGNSGSVGGPCRPSLATHLRQLQRRS
ncbi:hypothetical protein PybrP1_005130 [[Pythium] brassicae (nom. inval.)]|nr:hypothetical protein PybrP1_005130 [[Pythium] brassicae (nom. inval.)]